MKARFAIAAFSVALLGAGAASAQSVGTSPLTFQGKAPPACRMSTPMSEASQNAELDSAAPGAAEISIARLAGDDGSVIGANMALNIPVLCNQAHTLSVESRRGGLSLSQVPVEATAFRTSVPYRVRVSWAGANDDFSSDGSNAFLSIGDAGQGLLNVVIDIPAGGVPLVAGSYSDELVLVLSVAG